MHDKLVELYEQEAVFSYSVVLVFSYSIVLGRDMAKGARLESQSMGGMHPSPNHLTIQMFLLI